MGDEATGADVTGSIGGFLGDLVGNVIRYEEARAAIERARADSSGGYARATDGSLVKQSSQQPVTAIGAALVPVWVWVVGALGLGLVLVAVVRR